jgi:signal transduction histidine kinase/DNA-binding NarL/FixJ family response regulator
MDAKILIVDDEPAVLKLVTRFLVEAGYECFTAKNVKAAKKVLDSQDIELLLCDVKMPEESGLELIRYAKELHPRVGRIMITSLDSLEIASEIMSIGVYGYIVKPMTKNVVLITVENALRHLHLDLHFQACRIELEKKMSLRSEKLAAIMNNLTVGVVMLGPDMKIMEINRQMQRWFPQTAQGSGYFCYDAFNCRQVEHSFANCPLYESFQTGETREEIKKIKTVQGEMEFRVVTNAIFDSSGKIYAGIALYEDVTEKMILERDLRQSQKLEAVGQLAAGIAHEINSPIQYIGDNINFLKTSFADISKVLETYHRLWHQLVQAGAVAEDMDRSLSVVLEEADIEYLSEEISLTFDQSLDGVRRVDKIVRAMKEFSHPGSDEKTMVDINKIIENTTIVCRNEWKYVAELDTNFASDLPKIPCYQSEVSQVFLNIIVNAAHAIEEFSKKINDNRLGQISITTSRMDNGVRIQISDTGGGIPEKNQNRVFDPFFTTKPSGKGTGQGLAIAYRTVVNKHQGTIFFETETGKGTAFVIELPGTGDE